jgi:hypothetical protein
MDEPRQYRNNFVSTFSPLPLPYLACLAGELLSDKDLELALSSNTTLRDLILVANPEQDCHDTDVD